MSPVKSKEEREYARIVLKFAEAKTDEEIKLVNEEIAKFEKKHPKLVDEIQSRRWINYGDGT